MARGFPERMADEAPAPAAGGVSAARADAEGCWVMAVFGPAIDGTGPSPLSAAQRGTEGPDRTGPGPADLAKRAMPVLFSRHGTGSETHRGRGPGSRATQGGDHLQFRRRSLRRRAARLLGPLR